MGTSGNKDSQLASRSVVRDFTYNAATDDLSQTFFSKWGNTNADSVPASADKIFSLAVLQGFTAFSCADLMCKVRPRSKLQKTMDDFEYGYKNTTDLPPLSVNDNKDKKIISYACYMYRNEKP